MNIDQFKIELINKLNFYFAKFYTTLMSVPEKYLRSDDKIIIELFIMFMASNNTTMITEVDLPHKDIAQLTGLPVTKIRNILSGNKSKKIPPLSKKISSMMKLGLLWPGESISFSVSTIPGVRSTYHFEYIEPVRKTVPLHINQYKGKHGTQVKQEHSLRIAELNRLNKFFNISDLGHFADLYPLDRIKNSVDYYFYCLDKKLKYEPDGQLDYNYLAKIFSRPQWLKGMLDEKQKLQKYIEHLGKINVLVSEVVKEKKFSTRLDFTAFNTVTKNGQIKLSEIKDIKKCKELLQANLKTLSAPNFNAFQDMVHFAFWEIKYNTIFGGKNTASIKQDITIALLQTGYQTINVNE